MKRRSAPAFSLIEVVIALGVVSFGLIALLGLLSVGMTSDRSAGDDTSLGTMASRLLAELKCAPDAARLQSLTGAAYGFDLYGQPTAVQGDAYYACQITVTKTNLSSFAPDGFSLVRLQFVWPCRAASPPHTNSIYATLPFAY